MALEPSPRKILGEKDLNRVDKRDTEPRKHPQVSTALHTGECGGGRDENAQPQPPTKHTTKKPQATRKQNASKMLDVSEIHLEGEETGDVPIYDTCDEVRRKIRAFLKRDGVSQAALLRALGRCRPGGTPISASSFRMFMDQKGPAAGGQSGVFYAGYVFFEKVRLRDGKPKSKRREEMEEVWGGHTDRMTGRKGVSFSRMFTCHVSEVPVQDKYGMVHFVPRD